MAHHRGRGLVFGGVHDVEDSEEGIDSEFFNLLHTYNIDRNRFFPLSLRRARPNAKKGPAASERGGKRGRGKANEEELLRNLALIENKGSLSDAIEIDMVTLPADEDVDEVEKVEKPVIWEMPHPRFNAQLAVQDDALYIFGGTYEKGDQEFTFDEMWCIDLGKLDGVKEIYKRELEDWQGSDEESDDEDGEGDDEDDDDDEEVPESSIVSVEVEDPASTTASESIAPSEMDIEPETLSAVADQLPHPRPFEALRDFFARTSTDWQHVVIEAMKYERMVDTPDVKEIRKRAFDRAEHQWWDCREEVQALEEEQDAAGISEVVSLAERGGGEATAGRRR